MTRNCLQCGKVFEKKRNESENYWHTKKFCSLSCRNDSYKGKPSGALGGHWKQSEEFKRKCSERMRDERHRCWKGDAVGYDALHTWVSRKLGKPQKCAHCGTEQQRWYHWANVSGEYRRDLNDWLRLCVPCHSRFDKKRLVQV